MEVSTAQRTEIWRRWKAGESLRENRASISAANIPPFICCYRIMAGSFLPSVGAHPKRSPLAEREDISRGIASGSSIRTIATRLSRATSTVSREVARHGGRSVYRASEADCEAWRLALRPKQCLLANHERLRRIVVSKLIDAGLVA